MQSESLTKQVLLFGAYSNIVTLYLKPQAREMALLKGHSSGRDAAQ